MTADAQENRTDEPDKTALEMDLERAKAMEARDPGLRDRMTWKPGDLTVIRRRPPDQHQA